MKLTLLIAASISFAGAAPHAIADNKQEVVAGNNFSIPGQNATYDYVIVGGGSWPGSCISSRGRRNQDDRGCRGRRFLRSREWKHLSRASICEGCLLFRARHKS